MTVQELLEAAQQLSTSEQLQLASELRALAQRRTEDIQATSLSTEPTPIEDDPLVGLFSGSPDLSTKAKEILAREIKPASGFTWKDS